LFSLQPPPVDNLEIGGDKELLRLTIAAKAVKVNPRSQDFPDKAFQSA
jgi:hypothetical protein